MCRGEVELNCPWQAIKIYHFQSIDADSTTCSSVVHHNLAKRWVTRQRKHRREKKRHFNWNSFNIESLIKTHIQYWAFTEVVWRDTKNIHICKTYCRQHPRATHWIKLHQIVIKYQDVFRLHQVVLHENLQSEEKNPVGILGPLAASPLISSRLLQSELTSELVAFSICWTVCAGGASSWTGSSPWALPGPREGSRPRCVSSATTSPAPRCCCPAGWTYTWNVPLEPTWHGRDIFKLVYRSPKVLLHMHCETHISVFVF